MKQVGWVAILAAILLLGMVLAPAMAEPRSRDGAIAPGIESLPEALQERLERHPDRLLEEIAALIIGHGRDGTIDARGIAQFVALELARKQAYHLRRLQQGDLDGDGAIARDELAVLQAASSARQKGLLEMDHRLADGNRDGDVSARELFAMADARAREHVARRGLSDLAALIAFDRDGDGAIGLDEVLRGLAEMRGTPA